MTSILISVIEASSHLKSNVTNNRIGSYDRIPKNMRNVNVIFISFLRLRLFDKWLYFEELCDVYQ